MTVHKRTIEGTIRHRAQALAIKREKRRSPEFRAKEALAAKARYHKNKLKHRAKARERYEAKKDEINKRRRERRRENPKAARAQDRLWRSNSIKHWISELRRGRVSIDEIHRRIGESYVRLNERLEYTVREYAEDGGRDSKAASEPGPSEA